MEREKERSEIKKREGGMERYNGEIGRGRKRKDCTAML